MTDTAEFGIAVGGQAGGFGAFAGLAADLGTKLDTIHDTLKAQRGDPNPTRRPKVFGTITTGGIVATQIIQLQSDLQPSTGMIWNLRACGVFGATDAHSNVGGSYEIYAGALPLIGVSAFTPDVVDLVCVSNSIPAPAPGMFAFTGEVYWIRPTETIYAVVYGAPISTQLVLIALVDEYRLSDVEALTI